MACPTAQRVGTCGATIASLCPLRPFRTGSRLGGKKAQARMDTDFLDWALTDFSGYVAADALYDGPFCILSAVDNRRYKRLLYDVLDHDPTHDDIRAFLGRLKTALTARALTLLGITTDGSALSPAPLAEVFGGVRHQLCAFHIVADVVKAAYSTDSCHPIHGKVATQSTGSLPPSPRETCHSVHGKVATHSRRSLPPSERSDAGWHILSLNWLFLSTGPAVCAWILLVMEFYTRCGPDDRGWHRRASDLQEPHASARRGVGS